MGCVRGAKVCFSCTTSIDGHYAVQGTTTFDDIAADNQHIAMALHLMRVYLCLHGSRTLKCRKNRQRAVFDLFRGRGAGTRGFDSRQEASPLSRACRRP